MNKFLMLISAAFLLSACGVTPVQVNTLTTPPPEFIPEPPTEVVTSPVTWTVLTQAQIQELAKTNNPNLVFYALDPTNFANLATNMAEIKRYLQDQKIVILAYKSYYASLQQQPAPTK